MELIPLPLRYVGIIQYTYIAEKMQGLIHQKIAAIDSFFYQFLSAHHVGINFSGNLGSDYATAGCDSVLPQRV
jgi:hypothetical protein